MNILLPIYPFKFKRNLAGYIKKIKAQFCTRGGNQLVGANGFECLAPVVKLHIARMMLILFIPFN